jgi:ribosome biogenesis GTPase
MTPDRQVSQFAKESHRLNNRQISQGENGEGSPTPDRSPDGLVEGLIVDGSRGQYRVETPQGFFLCTIRGKLRKELVYPESTGARRSVRNVKVREKDPVAIGDRVALLPTGGGAGVIERVLARSGGAFTRGDPDAGGGALTTVAGLDQLVMVFAAREPAPHLRLLDRILVVAESQDLPAVICLNKVDLGVPSWLRERLAVYRQIGYRVALASAERRDGLDELRALLAGRVSAFVGPSGVGKSSLLNTLQPELGQRVSAVSGLTHKGRHTTTGARLFPLDGPEGGYIADTAGIRALAVADPRLIRLDHCFPEFRPYLGTCRLADCTHIHEPGCAVLSAVAARAIDVERYDSYCRLLTGEAAALDWEESD